MSDEPIKEEKIEEAKGVIVKGTNHFFYERDYNIGCKETKQIDIIHGYHMWWCSTHFQFLERCDRNIELKGQKEKFQKKLNRALTPYCCHVSGMHDPCHFEERPDYICSMQKEGAYNRTCKEFNLNPKVINNPNGCGWCTMDSEREENK